VRIFGGYEGIWYPLRGKQGSASRAGTFSLDTVYKEPRDRDHRSVRIAAKRHVHSAAFNRMNNDLIPTLPYRRRGSMLTNTGQDIMRTRPSTRLSVRTNTQSIGNRVLKAGALTVPEVESILRERRLWGPR